MPFDESEGKWIPWNKGKLVGQKAPLKPQEVWSIRGQLQLADNERDLARVTTDAHHCQKTHLRSRLTSDRRHSSN